MQRTRTLFLVLLVAALAAVAWWPGTETRAIEHSQAGLKRTMTTYAVARGLSAVISVAQNSQLALEPAGLGVVVAVGQALRPAADLLEQFSSLMLLAAVAFGVQILLIGIGAHWAVSALLTLVALAWAIALVVRGQTPRALSRLLLALLFVRFAVPLAALGSEAVYQVFLAPKYQQAQQGIEQSRGDLGRQAAGGGLGAVAEAAQADAKGSWWPKLPSIKGITDKAMAQAEQFKLTAERSIERMIDLMVVFVLQTIVLPLAFLWLLGVLGRSVASMAAGPSRRAAARQA